MGLLTVEHHTARERVELLSERVDLVRIDASRRLDPQRKAELGQFLSSAAIADLMASMLACREPTINMLDAGAGVGSLFSAVVAMLCERPEPPQTITVTAYELDDLLLPYLAETMDLCRSACERVGIDFQGSIHNVDFIEASVAMLRPGLFGSPTLPSINCVILNPPYLKIHSSSTMRERLQQLGIETSNLYTGFMAAAMRLLQPGGEFVAITPRSFCNGPYFRRFRQDFLTTLSLRRIHVFDSRQQAFRDDSVLQENVIVHAVKTTTLPAFVNVTASAAPGADDTTIRDVPYREVVSPDDHQWFIRIVSDELEGRIAERIDRLPEQLATLGVTVSTGRVVDFRAVTHLRREPDADTAPLIYPTHLSQGSITWPKLTGKKPNAIARNGDTETLLVPSDNYVLVKRFSSKEERRRVVATVIEPRHISGDVVGFENHLNYFHCNGAGLDLPLARGLAAFLNSTLVDAYFRQFNGHTQVNATDLRSLRYPPLQELRDFGAVLGDQRLTQSELDRLIESRLLMMIDDHGDDPIRAKERVAEALEMLTSLGFPKAQLNERSALTLLALVDLTPASAWSDAGDPLRGVTQLMDFFAEHYGKRYAPNSRETVRRQTIHQFLDAGVILINPDQPDRPTNSGNTVYQIERSALELIRTYGTPDWEHSLRSYLASVETLKARYAQERSIVRIPVEINDIAFTLSPGGQNVLVKAIVDEFASRFTPGGRLLYVGDTDDKFAYFDSAAMAALGVTIEVHGKMPDLILHDTARNWLVLIEAVTSHGPVDPKRRAELEQLFAGS